MEKERETKKQIEEDCEEIIETTEDAKIIKGVLEETDMTYQKSDTILSKFSIIYKRIMKQLGINREEDKKYVIDASITGNENFRDIISEILQTQAKIIFTSVTIDELDRIQKYNNESAVNARHILNLGAENSERCESVLIDETLETPDACIIKYCANNKKRVILVTSDKRMALDARMYGVQVEYYKSITTPFLKNNYLMNPKVVTLKPSFRKDEKLFIQNLHLKNLPNIDICVYSDGIECMDETIELKVGDEVFIAARKSNFITFSHFKLISTYAKDNCEIIFSGRVYDDEDEIKVPKALYKSFIKDFKAKNGY